MSSRWTKSEALLDTEMGVLSIRGKGLHMSRLTLEKGEADMDGTFQGFVYSDNGSIRKKGNPFKEDFPMILSQVILWEVHFLLKSMILGLGLREHTMCSNCGGH